MLDTCDWWPDRAARRGLDGALTAGRGDRGSRACGSPQERIAVAAARATSSSLYSVIGICQALHRAAPLPGGAGPRARGASSRTTGTTNVAHGAAEKRRWWRRWSVAISGTCGNGGERCARRGMRRRDQVDQRGIPAITGTFPPGGPIQRRLAGLSPVPTRPFRGRAPGNSGRLPAPLAQAAAAARGRPSPRALRRISS